MVDELRLRCAGTQRIEFPGTYGHREPVAVGQTVMNAMPQQLQSDLCDAAATDQPQHRLPVPKLEILAVDAGTMGPT